MGEGGFHEIERKYLIFRPDEALLRAQPGAERWEIVQTYLTARAPGEARRVRQVTVDGRTRYFRTAKRRLSALRAAEDEAEIDRDEYLRLLDEARPGASPILKARYRVPYAGRVLEFDLYTFWKIWAILEVELEDESEVPRIPDYVHIIREVTGERAFSNSRLAESHPMEPFGVV